MTNPEVWVDALDDACHQLSIPLPEKAIELSELLSRAAEGMREYEFHDKPSRVSEADNRDQIIAELKRQLRIEVSRRTGVPTERLKFADNGLIYHDAYYPHEGVGK